ncbi:MAG: VWA domain-containing protein [Candidatus Dependentiae bacterium]|nr:VWA domain-containing protein [Candidatus Dependentiae bacterium]
MINNLFFGSPEYSFIFIVCIVLVIMVWYRLHKTRRAIALLAGRWASVLIDNFSLMRAYAKLILTACGLFFLAIALLQPRGKEYEDTVEQQGRDVYFALDVSGSMLACDVLPNRLVCAKEKIKQSIARLSCERVGLILFSGSAFIQCPLTADIGAFMTFLNYVDVETISSGTTALDSALNTALEAFEHKQNKKNKLVVVFTDGEDFSASLPQVKSRAHEQGLHICAVGIGSLEGSPIPIFDDSGHAIGHQRDDSGAVVISRLNESLLCSLTHDLGGSYIRVTPDDTDVAALVKKVQSFEKEAFGDTAIKKYDEKYPFFVLASLVCFIAEWLL